jgi:group I intron endonuclease
MKAFVYWLHLPTHTDPFSQGYVGVSCDPKKRLRVHTWLAKKGRHENPILENVFNKHEKVLHTILLIGEENYCYEIENKMRPSKNTGWNINIGGTKPPECDWTGKTHTDETKLKMSQSKKEQFANNKWFESVWVPTHKGPSEEGKKTISEKAKARFQDKEWVDNVFTPAWKAGHGTMQGEQNPMFGKKHSDETLEKMKQAKQGKYDGSKNPMAGKNHSDEAKAKVSAAIKGSMWITNGDETRKIRDGDPIPEGFVKGRKLKTEHYSEIHW